MGDDMGRPEWDNGMPCPWDNGIPCPGEVGEAIRRELRLVVEGMLRMWWGEYGEVDIGADV
jgi:hypothetical protein